MSSNKVLAYGGAYRIYEVNLDYICIMPYFSTYDFVYAVDFLLARGGGSIFNYSNGACIPVY
jgi:hypothetical protein